MADLAAMILFAGIVLYTVFAGADFGAGFWDLTAGDRDRGRPVRALIEHSIGPVWEANHVWLIFCLVVLWSAFPTAFAAVATTLYLPLGLAALGIVLRGAGFAFRKAVPDAPEQGVTGKAFATSSVLTPFFLGAVAGGVASGRVTAAGSGAAITSWVNPTSILGGVMAVTVCAYLAAVFLTAEARTRGDATLAAAFQRRAVGAATVAGVVAAAGVVVLHQDSRRLFNQLLGPGLPLVIASGLSGLATLRLVSHGSPRVTRVFAAGAVASIVLGWGVAQYPYLLGTHLKISAAAAPSATLWSVVVVFGMAAVLCAPSLVLLYVMQQRGTLEPSDDAV